MVVQATRKKVGEVKDCATSTLKVAEDKPYEGDRFTKQHVNDVIRITQ